MKIGEMVKANTGHTGIIIDRELLYPKSPYSPVRYYVVMWSAGVPHYCRSKNGISKIDVFAVERLT